MMGCLKSFVFLVFVVAVAVLVFLNKDRLTTTMHRLTGDTAPVVLVPSRELADAAENKLQDLESGGTDRIVLTEVELQSLLEYKYRSLLPAFVDSPRVQLKGNKIDISARVPVDRIPQVAGLGDAASFLPDTTELAVTGELLPLPSGRIALAVDQVRAARIPLPHRLIAEALRKLGRKNEPGLPPEALAMPLPPGADAAYVRGDSLVLISNVRRPAN